MGRFLRIAANFLLLVSGWFSAFLVTGYHGRSSLFLLMPVFLLGTGMGLQLKLTHIRITVITLALAAVIALGALNLFFPHQAPRLSNLKPAVITADIPVAVKIVSDGSVEVGKLQSAAAVTVHPVARLPAAAQAMFSADDGHLYMSLPDLGAVYVLPNVDSAEYIDRPILFQAGLDRPFGLVKSGDKLLVAEPSRIVELEDLDGNLQADRERIFFNDLPDDGGHWMRALAVDSQGMLYLSIGSRCNACEEEDRRRGTIVRIDPHTGIAGEFARGLRNSVGLAVSPVTDVLWGTDVSRELPGGPIPPDELNQILEGGDYGWPYCFGRQIPDPQLGSPRRCRDTRPPEIELPPLCRPQGIIFGTGLRADELYRNSIYIVCTGTDHSSGYAGPEIVRVGYERGTVEEKYVDFLTGWQTADGLWGRPVALVVSAGGAMYFSDERNRTIYRLTWTEQAPANAVR